MPTLEDGLVGVKYLPYRLNPDDGPAVGIPDA